MTDEAKKTEGTPAAETMQKLLQEKDTKLAKYEKLMQDPSIQLVLEKMANGEEVILAEAKQETTQSMKQMLGTEDKPEDLDIDSLSNKDLVSVMSESVEKYVGQVREEVADNYKQELQAMKQELSSTQEHLLKMTAQSQVKEASTKYADFETYRPEMQKIAEIYPNMSIDDLYIQAKGKHLMESPDIRTLETEKPESSSPFPAWEPNRIKDLKTGETKESGGPSTTALRNSTNGRKAFANIVGHTAERLLKKQLI